ncbi:hypothetical protein NC99_26460 [Sunxiuqinia dokdonensis]|uniref:Uncharacterized protein n=1 Tax=Sunxiuqinia dokdonensis TaxID=1409788 RepID=A0A0L8V8P4_9BACT|nr:hypothetical protein NC99_26460 [Sunxiuqinia dokdonensis]
MLKYPSLKKIRLLYHLIYSSKFGDGYLLNTSEEIKRFVAFIDSSLNENDW